MQMVGFLPARGEAHPGCRSVAGPRNRLSEIETNPGKLAVERLLELANLLGLELVTQNRPSTQRSSKTEW